MSKIEIDLSKVYQGNAKIGELEKYLTEVLEIAGSGNDIVLNWAGTDMALPKGCHALHGKARKLIYKSPVTSEITIFNHSID